MSADWGIISCMLTLGRMIYMVTTHVRWIYASGCFSDGMPVVSVHSCRVA